MAGADEGDVRTVTASGTPPEVGSEAPVTAAVDPRRRGSPSPVSEMVSQQMSQMPRVGTMPERALRREIHRRGMRYVIAPSSLPGSPDIAFTRARLAVFVDGCFWHGCPVHGTIPKHNRDWWIEKFEENRARDTRKDTALRELGWFVIHIWEHEDTVIAAEKIECLWRSRTGRSVRRADRGCI
jgi:DNA mismatch endonuclease (patch repair protein)